MTRAISFLVVLAGMMIFAACGGSGEQTADNSREVAAQKAVVENANISEAAIVWTGSKFTGGKHTGTLGLKSHQLQFENGQLVGGTIEVDMTSLANTDLEGDMNQKLVGHLSSDDFFSVANYPTSTLQITNVEAGAEPNTYKVSSNLTIKDSTHSEIFDVKVEEAEDKLVFSTNFDVDRTKYDVRYGSSSFFADLGDKAINDNFNLDVRIVTEK